MNNNYLFPKPIGRDYTEREQHLLQEIKRLESERGRANRSIKDAHSLYGQVQRKYEHKPITMKPDKNTMSLEEYNKLLQRHNKDTGQDELLKHRNMIADRENQERCIYNDICNKVEILKELVKK